MATYEKTARFDQDWLDLTREEQRRFQVARLKFVDDLNAGQGYRAGLRIKGVHGHPGVFELTWAPDGRATFEVGAQRKPGHTHIIWRRVGRHDIFSQP